MKAITIRPPVRKRISATAVGEQTAAAEVTAGGAANPAVAALSDAATTVTAASITALAATVRAASGQDGQNTSAAEDVDLAVDSAISTASAVAGAGVFLNLAAGFGKAAITTASAALVGPAFKLMGAAGAGLVLLDEAGAENQTALSGQQIEGGLLYAYAASLVAAEALKSTQSAPATDVPVSTAASSPSVASLVAADTLESTLSTVAANAPLPTTPSSPSPRRQAARHAIKVLDAVAASPIPAAPIPAVVTASVVVQPEAATGVQSLSAAPLVTGSTAEATVVASKPLDRLRALLLRPPLIKRMLILVVLSTVAVASGQWAGSPLLVRRMSAMLLLPFGSFKLALTKLAGLPA